MTFPLVRLSLAIVIGLLASVIAGVSPFLTYGLMVLGRLLLWE